MLNYVKPTLNKIAQVKEIMAQNAIPLAMLCVEC